MRPFCPQSDFLRKLLPLSPTYQFLHSRRTTRTRGTPEKALAFPSPTLLASSDEQGVTTDRRTRC
eukprot:961228-Rhodomonas_salina.2